MSLQTALTGLMSAQTGIDTTSNNLANANTTGYKNQTSLFESIFPQEGSGDDAPGIGAEVEGISTNLTQGSLNQTGNSLDAAIQGNGYFVVNNNGVQQYTRDGAFQLGSNGQIETLNGGAVLGYSNNTSDNILSSSLGPITINTGAAAATATTNIGITFNLNSGASVPTGGAFDPTDPSTYNNSTSVTAYDAQGNANHMQLYTVDNANNTWTIYAVPQNAAGTNILSSPSYEKLATLGFSGSGGLASVAAGNSGVSVSGNTATLPIQWSGQTASSISFNFSGTTSQAQTYSISGLTNNGNSPGNFAGIAINNDGSVMASYTNGQTVCQGKIALATFLNAGSLTPITGNLYTANGNSGAAAVGQAETGEAGTLAGGELEASNVSTSNMLVALIQYQQAYQANTSVIQTEQQDSQRLLQI